MAKDKALYLTIAQRYAAQGETGRAIITMVNALANNPQYIDLHPEALDLLAEILVPGFEEEIHRLALRNPAFGKRLSEALIRCNRADFAQKLDKSFEEYCVQQLRSIVVDQTPATVCYPEETQQEIEYRHQSGEFDWHSVDTEGRQPQAQSCEWMVSAVQIDAVKNIRDSARHDFRKEETPNEDAIRRFDRMRALHAAAPVVGDYADVAVDRVIIDFDNSIPETPKSEMFSTQRVKIRSYAQEVAAFKSSSENQKISRVVNDPMERVAEMTHALSETPSVEPYVARNPLRFQLKPQHIVTCISLCLLGFMGWIVWINLAPTLEQRDFERDTSEYLAIADEGKALPPLPEDVPLSGSRLFLNTWQSLHYGDSTEFPVKPGEPEFPNRNAAALAAWITWAAHHNQSGTAKKLLQSVPSSVWRGQNYLHEWSLAQIEESSGDFGSASLRYEKLIQSPLSSFALVQIGMAALDSSAESIHAAAVFTEAYDNAASPLRLATCIRNILNRGETGLPSDAVELNAPYQLYCDMAQIRRQMEGGQAIDPMRVTALENAHLDRGEPHRVQIVLEALLYQGNIDRAVNFYQSQALPSDHPLKLRLRDALLDWSLSVGNWRPLYKMYPELPQNLEFLAVARLYDHVRAGNPISELRLDHPQSLILFGAGKPGAAVSETDEIYIEARRGNWGRALTLSRSLLLSHPDALEPLFLQAEILSHAGRALEAAQILESSANNRSLSAPAMILSNLYRARGGLPLNEMAIVLPWISFGDNALSAARCEILWRMRSSGARRCIADLRRQTRNISKNAWILSHLNAPSSSVQWMRADADDLSFPGFALELARRLEKEGALTAAATAYSRAILRDPFTATPQTVDEFEHFYSARQRRYEGTKMFESLIAGAERMGAGSNLLGALHLAAARLYQPQSAHPQARVHLGRALDFLGDQEEILSGLVTYYETKNKPEHARNWRARLSALRTPPNGEL